MGFSALSQAGNGAVYKATALRFSIQAGMLVVEMSLVLDSGRIWYRSGLEKKRDDKEGLCHILIPFLA